MLIIKKYYEYYSSREIKELLDSLLSDDFIEFEDEYLCRILYEIFNDIEIEKKDDSEYYISEKNFPDDFIPPIA